MARKPSQPQAKPHVGPIDDDFAEDLVDAGSREHYADAELYDYEYRRRRADVTYYRELARSQFGGAPGRILELGCGSGRLTMMLAHDGHEVVAVDQSTAMLARLRARIAAAPSAIARRITPVAGDLRDFSVEGKFPLVLAAFNVFEHLYTRVELAACLDRVTEHLAIDGRLAFDVQMPDLRWLSRDPEKRWARTKFTHPRTGEKLIYSTNHDYDPVSQIALIRIYYDPQDAAANGAKKRRSSSGGTVVKLSQRKFFPAELEALLASSGYALVSRHGDFAGSPLDGSAESQVIVCRINAARSINKPTRR